MMIRVEFDTESAAFEDSIVFSAEVSRILRDVAERIANGAMLGPLHDVNGNKIGYFEVIPGRRVT